MRDTDVDWEALEYLGVGEWIIINYVLKKLRSRIWSRVFCPEYGAASGHYEQGSEPSGFVLGEEVIVSNGATANVSRSTLHREVGRPKRYQDDFCSFYICSYLYNFSLYTRGKSKRFHS
jgi:hypothetical protein